MKYATASPTQADTKPSKMKIFDLENAQKEKEDGSLTELSPYDSMAPAEKSEKDENEAIDPSNDNEKLLEWNKDEIDLFEENKAKPSHLTSLATQEYEKRTSKRQARQMSKSLKEHISQTSNTHESLFKPNMNVNPLVEASSKTDVEDEPKIDVNALYAKPDPEVVQSKTMKRMEADDRNVTAVVNEFFDEEEPNRDGKLPNPPPVESTATDDTKEDVNTSDEPNDHTPDNNTTNVEPNTTDTEPLVKIDDDESVTTQKQNTVPTDDDKATIDKDKAIDVQTSPTSKDAPENEGTKAEEDAIAKVQMATVKEEPAVVTEEEKVTLINEEEAEGETMGMSGDADNLPLVDIKKSATKTPSSPGKFGLRVNN